MDDYEVWADGNADDETEHGKKRKKRGLDLEEIRQNGERFRDTDSGGIVYVDGEDVVIDGVNGNVTEIENHTEQETQLLATHSKKLRPYPFLIANNSSWQWDR